MNEEVDYFVQMDPNMISGIRIIRLTFDQFWVDYAYATDDVDAFTAMSEIEWGELDKNVLVAVDPRIIDVWGDPYPMGTRKIDPYAL